MRTLKYIGQQDRWPELAVTGRSSHWRLGQTEERTDAEATLLLGTGLFAVPPREGDNGTLLHDVWTPAPAIFKLRLVGTGTVAIAGRDRLGVVTEVESFSIAGATNQIEYPYLGDGAAEIRARYTGAVTAEVM